MRIIKVGDTVLASLFSGQKVTGKVEGIEICARDSKEGRPVSKCDLSKHKNGIVSLDCGHWCYFHQIRTIN